MRIFTDEQEFKQFKKEESERLRIDMKETEEQIRQSLEKIGVIACAVTASRFICLVDLNCEINTAWQRTNICIALTKYCTRVEFCQCNSPSLILVL